MTVKPDLASVIGNPTIQCESCLICRRCRDRPKNHSLDKSISGYCLLAMIAAPAHTLCTASRWGRGVALIDRRSNKLALTGSSAKVCSKQA